MKTIGKILHFYVVCSTFLSKYFVVGNPIPDSGIWSVGEAIIVLLNHICYSILWRCLIVVCR